MLKFIKKIDTTNFDYTICLDYERREKARIKTNIVENGEVAGIFMSRGIVLQDGDLITTSDGVVAKIIAKKENVSSVYTQNILLFAKACYHLGNRHVKLEINDNSLHYQPDTVLNTMLENFGLEVIMEQRIFNPEIGAYHSH